MCCPLHALLNLSPDGSHIVKTHYIRGTRTQTSGVSVLRASQLHYKSNDGAFHLNIAVCVFPLILYCSLELELVYHIFHILSREFLNLNMASPLRIERRWQA